MKTKKTFKVIGVVLFFYFIDFCFGIVASVKGYQISLSNFIEKSNNQLAPDFSLNIGVAEQIFSVIYILAFVALAFFAGKLAYKTLFSGMMWYSAMPFLGLLGYLFIKKGIKLGIIMLLTLIWSYPYFPLAITGNSFESIIVPIGIFMFATPVAAIIAYTVGKKL